MQNGIGCRLETRVLIHKDFHYEHGVVGERLAVIDFDEARLGNPTFDLARGPYSPLPAALVEGARHGYTTLARAAGAPGGDDVKGGSL